MTIKIMPLNDSPIADAASWATLAGNWLGDGVVRGVRNELAVTAGAGMAVQVNTGRAMLQGVVVDSDAAETVTLDAADATNDRIDLIVVRVDFANGTSQSGFYAVTGTPATAPAAPAVTQVAGSVWEIALAKVYVHAGATDISAADVTDIRQYAASIHDASYDGTARTINVSTTDDAQAVLDAANHYIAPGDTVHVVLADGVHARTSPLYIRGWYGGGLLIIQSAAGDTSLHSDQPVTLDFSAGNCNGIVITHSTCPVEIRDVKVIVDTASTYNKAIEQVRGTSLTIRGCYVQGTSTEYGTGVAVEDGSAVIREIYADTLAFGIRADAAAVVWAYNNDDIGTTPKYGGYANGGTLHRAGTVISGSVADAASGAGGTYT